MNKKTPSKQLQRAIEMLDFKRAVALTENIDWRRVESDHWQQVFTGDNLFEDIQTVFLELQKGREAWCDKEKGSEKFNAFAKRLLTYWMDQGYNPLIESGFFVYAQKEFLALDEFKATEKTVKNFGSQLDQTLSKWLIDQCFDRQLLGERGNTALTSFFNGKNLTMSAQLIPPLIQIGFDPNSMIRGVGKDKYASQTGVPALAALFFTYHRKEFGEIWSRGIMNDYQSKALDLVIEAAWALIEHGADPFLSMDPLVKPEDGKTIRQALGELFQDQHYKDHRGAHEFLNIIDARASKQHLMGEVALIGASNTTEPKRKI